MKIYAGVCAEDIIGNGDRKTRAGNASGDRSTVEAAPKERFGRRVLNQRRAGVGDAGKFQPRIRTRSRAPEGRLREFAAAKSIILLGVAGHAELRDASPLTYVASMSRQRARHRGPGDLVLAMVSLGKFRILQEVAAHLPRDQRLTMLEMLQRASRESARSRRSAPSSSDATGSPRQIYRARPESDLVDSSLRLSPGIRERRIILEHQRQLEREMQEMHDTLRRNALTRHRGSGWDSNSVSSWSSSIDSFAGTITLRRYRPPIWDALKGGSAARTAGQQLDRGAATNKSEEMISREESPTWNAPNARRLRDESRNGDELPSWDALEATLNRRLCNYGNALAETSRADAERIGGRGTDCFTRTLEPPDK